MNFFEIWLKIADALKQMFFGLITLIAILLIISGILLIINYCIETFSENSYMALIYYQLSIITGFIMIGIGCFIIKN